jgi:hypothetical protein
VDDALKLFDVVALVEDLLAEGLFRGQVGSIVEKWAPGVYEVEFSDRNGIDYAMLTLKEEQLMLLRYERVKPRGSEPPPAQREKHGFIPCFFSSGP